MCWIVDRGEKPRHQEYEQFIEEDNIFATTVIDRINELERRRKAAKELFVPRGKSDDPALAEQLVQLQIQLEQLMIERQQRKEGPGAQGPHHSSNNLPKLEIPSFNGDEENYVWS